MSKLPDPEDIDVFVGGVEPEPAAAIETERIIEEYKKRPDHPLKVEEAKRRLAALGIDAPDYGVPDARSLLEHWEKCVAELHQREPRETNGTGSDNRGLRGNPGISQDELSRPRSTPASLPSINTSESPEVKVANLMPSDIKAQVREVLESARKGKGDRPNYLTAFQILQRLPETLKSRLIEERGIGGKGSGQSYAAPSVVSDAAELIPDVEIDYIDSGGLAITVADTAVLPSYEVCGLYRIKTPE